jgi:hypothetical protein
VKRRWRVTVGALIVLSSDFDRRQFRCSHDGPVHHEPSDPCDSDIGRICQLSL